MTDEDVVVKIPKGMADYIQKQLWFKYYHDLDDFIVDATRLQMESWMRTEAKKIIGKNIQLLTVKEKGATGFSVCDNIIQISVDQETYDKFEKDAKKHGMKIDDALGHALLTLLRSGLP